MISVVLPTYNERGNLEELFQRIDNAVEKDYEILVVDDNSPDGTAGKARQLADAYPVRIYLREEDHGLSQSVIKGLEEAKGGKAVIMDADLQHPPEKIPELVDEAGSGRIAVGSRFKEDGAVGHWGLTRKFINRVGSTFASLVIRNGMTDPMSGFFALETGDVDLDELDVEGFKILLEILHRHDLEVEEVQYRFRERNSGESQMGLKVAVDYFEQLGKIVLDDLGFQQSKRIVKAMEFMAVGGTGVLVNSVIFLAVIHYSIHYPIAGALAFLGALHWNFFWNREITFDKSVRSFRHQYIYFFLVNLGGFAIYEAFLFALIGGLNIWKPLANIMAIFGGFLWNFFGSEKIAFE